MDDLVNKLLSELRERLDRADRIVKCYEINFGPLTAEHWNEYNNRNRKQ